MQMLRLLARLLKPCSFNSIPDKSLIQLYDMPTEVGRTMQVLPGSALITSGFTFCCPRRGAACHGLPAALSRAAGESGRRGSLLRAAGWPVAITRLKGPASPAMPAGRHCIAPPAHRPALFHCRRRPISEEHTSEL